MKPWNAPNGATFDLDTPEGCTAAYYLSGSLQNTKTPRPWPKPPVVPSRIRLRAEVRGDFPIAHTSCCPAGEYDCDCNQYGAVFVKDTNGKLLGVCWNEFETIAWRDNET